MGEAVRVKQYQKAVQYAERYAINISIALRRIKAFDLGVKKLRTASKCPCCKRHELRIDSTDFEFTSNESWVWCSECGYTSDITKRYEPLQAFYLFDIVGSMSSHKEDEFGDDWEAFALKDTIELEQELYG